MSFVQNFVASVYADHNASPAVRTAIAGLLADAPADAFILNIGAGQTRLDPRVRSLELEAAPGIDIVGSATALPLADGSVDLIVTQEVFEHVDDPFLAMREIHRVLKPGAKAYVQLPFTIGFHPCPDDYWRFTHQGIEQLSKQAGFRELTRGTSVGPATGAYRVAVEFFAILFSLPFRRTYRPLKGVFALLLYPVKWLDWLMIGHAEADRISGGYFVILIK